MLRILTVMMLVGFLSACTTSNTPEAVGEHNLSKGHCEEIQTCQGQECQALKDESVQYVCEMVNGEFVPRDHRERRWF